MSITYEATSLSTNTPELLEELANQTGSASITITMPTFESGRNVNQNSIRYKNLVNAAAEQLDSSATDEAVAKQRLGVLGKLIPDEQFWQHQGKGLAVYVADDFVRLVKLEQAPPELVRIDDGFLVLPLILTKSDPASHLLKLTWETAELCRATDNRLVPIESRHFPVAMHDVVLPADKEPQLQFRTQQGGIGGAMYHGQNKKEQVSESDRKRFLSEVAKRLQDELGSNFGGLHVVATDEVYGHFCAQKNDKCMSHIAGSPDGMTMEDILQRYAEQASGRDARNRQLRERLSTAIAHQQGSSDLSKILTEAGKGRIEELLIDQESTADEHINELNSVVRLVQQTGGQIHPCDLEGDFPCAAIYRF